MRWDPQDNLEPFQISKRKFADLLDSPRLAQRALFHKLVTVTVQGGRGKETKIDYQSAKMFYRDWVFAGRQVPLLPSEIRRNENCGESRKPLKPSKSRRKKKRKDQ